MKKLILAVGLGVLLWLTAGSAADLIFTVTNPLKMSRPAETIELSWSELRHRRPGLQADRVRIIDLNTGRDVPTQVIDMEGDGRPEQLILQTDFSVDDPVKTFCLQQTAEPVTRLGGKVYGRFVPERKDDFAWENDRVAFRIYGKALESELISSGIDVWAKRVPHLIIEKWYAAGEVAYHKDGGEGLDFYAVSGSRGCGGSGLWDGQTLQVSKNFHSFRRIANGPLRVMFELTYEPWSANNRPVSEIKRISLDAGQNLNRIESIFTTSETGPLNVGVGIAIHKEWPAVKASNSEQGWLSRWEDVPDNGSLGCGIIVDRDRLLEFRDLQNNQLAIVQATANAPVRYYAGAGWDRGGQFNDRKKWETYLQQFSQRIQAPVVITFLNSYPEYSKKQSAPVSWSQIVAESVLKTYPDPARLEIYGSGWTYTNGLFLHGLHTLWQRTKRQDYFNYIKAWVDLQTDKDGRLLPQEYNPEEYKLDDVEAGKVALLLYHDTGDKKYLNTCDQLIAQMNLQPRTHDGGFWHKQIYPWQMWLDGIYMADAFLLQYAALLNQPHYYDEAVKQIQLISDHTRDSRTGLFYHGWDETKNPVWADPKTGASPEFWGRAIGWFAMALVDGLEYLPATHPQRTELLKLLQQLSADVAKYQDPKTGLWCQVLDKVDRPDNWHETSCTAMFAYTFAKGARKQYLAVSYRKLAERAFKGMCNYHVYFDESNRFYLTGTVKVGTLNLANSRGDYQYYISTDRRINDFKGVGSFLLAALELEQR